MKPSRWPSQSDSVVQLLLELSSAIVRAKWRLVDPDPLSREDSGQRTRRC
jgi:hypothetical protein